MCAQGRAKPTMKRCVQEPQPFNGETYLVFHPCAIDVWSPQDFKSCSSTPSCFSEGTPKAFIADCINFGNQKNWTALREDGDDKKPFQLSGPVKQPKRMVFKDLNLAMCESKEVVTVAAPHDTGTQRISNTENNHPLRTTFSNIRTNSALPAHITVSVQQCVFPTIVTSIARVMPSLSE